MRIKAFSERRVFAVRLLHSADWHLGKSIFGRSMLPEQEYFVEHAFLPAVDSIRPDAVLLAGDIFDRPVAPVEALRLFGRVVSELCGTRKIPVFVIAGNHDGPDRLALYAPLLGAQGLFLSARPLDTPPVRLRDERGEVFVHLLPYFDAAQARDLLGRDDIHGQQEAFRAMMEAVRPVPGARNVLVAHCFAAGGATCESESPLAVGGSEEVDPAVFAGFDYVALGHLHGPQRAGENGAYSGSPLKYSFDEERHKKSLALVTLAETATVERLPVKPLHDLRVISGTAGELCEAAETDPAREDFVYAELADTRPVYEPMALLREHYPNILGLRPGWLEAGETAREGLREGVRTGSGDRMLFETFLRQVCGVEPQEDELTVFAELMRQAENGEAPAGGGPKA